MRIWTLDSVNLKGRRMASQATSSPQTPSTLPAGWDGIRASPRPKAKPQVGKKPPSAHPAGTPQASCSSHATNVGRLPRHSEGGKVPLADHDSSGHPAGAGGAPASPASCRPRGLCNLGNSCYFNSSLQLLLSCPPLVAHMLGGPSPQAAAGREGHAGSPGSMAVAAPASRTSLGRGPLGYSLQQAMLHG